MNKGYIKLYRKTFDKYYFKKNKDAFYLFNYYIARCCYEDKVVHDENLKRGQFKTSLQHISDDTFISVNRIRTINKNLIEKKMISVKTSNNGTIITVKNYSNYQEKSNTEIHKQTHKQTHKQINTLQPSNNRTQSETPTSELTSTFTSNSTQDFTTKKKKRRKEENNNNIYSRIKDAFNDTCSSLPKCTKITDQRKRMIDARLKDYTVDDFETVFELAQASDFLSGRNKQWTNCNFDWLIKPNNFVKVIERTYNTNKHNEEHRKGFLSG